MVHELSDAEAIPQGIASSSPGLRAASYPGLYDRIPLGFSRGNQVAGGRVTEAHISCRLLLCSFDDLVEGSRIGEVKSKANKAYDRTIQAVAQFDLRLPCRRT
jgi:hypothetical protein